MLAVELEGVSKWFGENLALDNISMVIEEGQSVLLLGPNGAGKSTLLRCILGIIDFKGRISVLGLDVRKHGREVRRHVGYVPQNIRYQEGFSVMELVDHVSDIKGVDVFLDESLSQFRLEDMAYAKVGSLSSGMRQRLAISLALIGDPQLLILDEPFNNLDPVARNRLSELLGDMARRGKTVVVSVHTMSGLIHSFDGVAVLNGGRLVKMMKAEEVVRVARPVYKIHIRVEEGWRTYNTENLFATLKELEEGGYDVSSAWIEEPDAEELLRTIIG
jgi:ABC-type multidrug transport system ATPase subunit